MTDLNVFGLMAYLPHSALKKEHNASDGSAE